MEKFEDEEEDEGEGGGGDSDSEDGDDSAGQILSPRGLLVVRCAACEHGSCDVVTVS